MFTPSTLASIDRRLTIHGRTDISMPPCVFSAEPTRRIVLSRRFAEWTSITRTCLGTITFALVSISDLTLLYFDFRPKRCNNLPVLIESALHAR